MNCLDTITILPIAEYLKKIERKSTKMITALVKELKKSSCVGVKNDKGELKKVLDYLELRNDGKPCLEQGAKLHNWLMGDYTVADYVPRPVGTRGATIFDEMSEYILRYMKQNGKFDAYESDP